MTGRKRCDEILRLIDQVLADQDHADTAGTHGEQSNLVVADDEGSRLRADTGVAQASPAIVG